MAATRKQTRAKQQYRKPVIQKRQKLADVAEAADTVILSGRVSG